MHLCLSCGQTLRLFVDVENPDSSTKFQWYRSNELINGRESRELLIHSVIDSDGGDYYCRVTNCAGSTDSQVARVSISNGQGPLVRAPDRWGQYGRMGYWGRGEPEDEDEPCGQPVPSSAPPTSANACTTQVSSSCKSFMVFHVEASWEAIPKHVEEATLAYTHFLSN